MIVFAACLAVFTPTLTEGKTVAETHENLEGIVTMTSKTKTMKFAQTKQTRSFMFIHGQ